MNIFYAKGMPVIGFGRSTKKLKSLKYLDYYPAYTIKKKAIKIFVVLSILFGCNRLQNIYFKLKKNKNWINAEKIRDELLGALIGAEYHDAMIFWSTHVSRNRVYFYLFDENGNNIGFGKLYLDKKDYTLLDREKKAIITLSGKKMKNVSIPCLQKSGSIKGGRYIVVDPLPKNNILVRQNANNIPFRIMRDYSGRLEWVNKNEITNTSWWKDYLEKSEKYTELEEYRKNFSLDEVPVCRVHGDLGSSNIFMSSGRYWIVDWEQYYESAPYLVDIMSYWLGANYKGIICEKKEFINRVSVFAKMNDYDMRDVILSIIYLISVENNLADIVAKNWKYVKK